jgi:hypothetical protein
MDAYFLDWKLKQAREVVTRLERISADSCWAHQSSGVRGTLWRSIDRLERSLRGKARFNESDLAELEERIDLAYAMLTSAAREIPFKPEK